MSFKDKNRINLIYIVSNGRSGSTLLELMLNNFDDVWTMGEICVLPWELKYSIQRCGCGKEAKDCEFWQEVVKNVESVDEEVMSPFRDTYRTGKVLRLRHLFGIIAGREPKGKSFENFCRSNTELSKSVVKVVNLRDKKIDKIVSSSKGPYRLFWLSRCKSFDVRAIHVIKDPRAFVYSMTKGKSGIRFLVRFLRANIRYVVENWVIRLVLKRMPEGSFKLVRYEDLSSNPEKVMGEIAGWLGISGHWNRSSLEDRENHGVSGNAMRFRPKEIVLDEKWKKELNPLLKGMIVVFTYFSGRKYNYFK